MRAGWNYASQIFGYNNATQPRKASLVESCDEY